MSSVYMSRASEYESCKRVYSPATQQRTAEQEEEDDEMSQVRRTSIIQLLDDVQLDGE